MAISFEVSAEVESLLAAQYPDPGQAAKEALAIEGYRTGKLGIGALRQILGFQTRWEAEHWLFERNVPINYGPEDLEADCRTLDRLFDEKS